MSRNFIFTPQAEADAAEIWDYIADDESEKTADRVIARLFDECQKLGDMPGIGHHREALVYIRHRFWSALC